MGGKRDAQDAVRHRVGAWTGHDRPGDEKQRDEHVCGYELRCSEVRETTRAARGRPLVESSEDCQSSVFEPSIVACEPVPTWIRRGFGSSGFATWISSTPSL